MTLLELALAIAAGFVLGWISSEHWHFTELFSSLKNVRGDSFHSQRKVPPGNFICSDPECLCHSTRKETNV